MFIFAITVFVSSFLVFSVQPMVAKLLLPSFGGTAAVWATCLVFFQVLLLCGYAYAHWLRSALSPRAQRWTHLGLLAVALFFLPPTPRVVPSPAGGPVWELLRCLFVSVGVPFFALSSTAPLLMEWFRQRFQDKPPHRLYAFSNAGSLLALLAYPALVEPLFTQRTQGRVWAAGVGVFFLLCAAVALRVAVRRQDAGCVASYREEGTPGPVLRTQDAWLWAALPACGSGLLLALTNQISQDVAPMPLLWVAPMVVYLLTFILCFEGSRVYRRGLFFPACFAAFLLLAWLLDQGYLRGFSVQVGGYLVVLFISCMVCHGELYRLRPEAKQLTSFYLAIALGGALGGIFVALVAPAVFKTFLETPLIAIALAALCSFILWRDRSRRGVLPAIAGVKPRVGRVGLGRAGRRDHSIVLVISGTVIVAASFGYVLQDQWNDSICYARSFYGAYRVKQGPTLLLNHIDYPLKFGEARVLVSGQIYHGLQFLAPNAATLPTAYYCREGGLGVAFQNLPAKTNRNIGVVGLGTGTLAAYAQAGDRIRFYELNPDVVRIAQMYFTFLKDCPGKVDVVLGDGRLSLAREPNQHFDLLVLDAFAGDSIPMHLLTAEAMQVYLRHIRPGGVIAFHISNSHLDLELVVRAMASICGWQAMVVPAKRMDPGEGGLASIWMLLSTNSEFLERPAIARLPSSPPVGTEPLLWTDDHSSILPILH